MAAYKRTSDHNHRLLNYTDSYVQSTDVDFGEEEIWMMSSWAEPKPEPAPTNRAKTWTQNHRHQPGGLSLTFDSSTKRHVAAAAAASAPMNVPVWPAMARAESCDSMNHSVEDESEWVPPHEYLARERGKMTKSVFEGVGRTLKGRDLSRVRDAVWSQTGFFG